MSKQGIVSIEEFAGRSFDFVIIGGGTAGLALANRLSENPDITVAVLEAGKAHLNDSSIAKPDGWTQQFMRPEYDWRFSTVPQAHANDGTYMWNRGKGLGGTSAMNFLLWNRPQREDIDAFERLGNPGWNYNQFANVAKRTERFVPPMEEAPNELKALYDTSSLGLDGAIPISFSSTGSGAEVAFQKTLEKQGIRIIQDSMRGETVGTWKSISSIDAYNGTRSSSLTAYLMPIIDRPNLRVLTEAYVTKILSSIADGLVVATGVEFEYGGVVYQVNATKEVILSAGTIKSPQILELSGIGDRRILEPLGIPVQRHLPAVGTNVQDHICQPRLTFEMRENLGVISSNMLRNPDVQASWAKAYQDINGTPSLVVTSLTFLPFETVSDNAASLIEKQAERIAQNVTKYPPGLKEQYEIQLELLRNSKVPDVEIIVWPFSFSPNAKDKPYIALSASISHPFSRGTIHITSRDPKVSPAIDPHYLEEPIDLEILVEVVKFSRRIAKLEPFRDLVVKEDIPGESVITDEQLISHVRGNLSSTWHTSSSLSMLPEDKGGVVDPTLKVYGTKNIRVADLSVVPLLVAAHTQAIVYEIAERAAETIKAEHGL